MNFFADLSWWTLFVWTGRLVGVALMPAVLLQRSTRPLATLVWILSLLFLPYLGALAWWLVGRDTIKRRRRRHYRARKEMATKVGSLEQSIFFPAPTLQEDRPTDVDPRFALVTRNEFNIFPATGTKNQVVIFSTSAKAFDGFETAIQNAQDHIHFQFYIWKADRVGTRFRDLLVEKARAGLEVRVLFDAIGGASIDREFTRPLREAGAKVATFLPVYIWERRLRVNFRNHRKILIIDGKCGFTGGVNVADEYLEWRDMALGFQGPVVQQMQEVFAEDWFFATKEDLATEAYFPLIENSGRDYLPDDSGFCDVPARFVASGPDDPLQTIHKMFFFAIINAQERIDIVTPYFVPDGAVFTALQTAAMQGVQIRIILPGKTDVLLAQYAGRSFWESLLEVGVKLYEYEESILHAKLLLLDNTHSLIGSANMDVRSFRLNFEANAVIEDQGVNLALSEVFEDLLQKSSQIRLHEFRQRSRKERLFEGTARLFSPLL